MKHINEYLLSKKNKQIAVEPKFRCSIDELKYWLMSLGVEENEFIMFDGNAHLPAKGKRSIDIGPCYKEHDNTFWISIMNSNLQKICIRTKTESFYQNYGKNANPTDFETALEMAEWMIKHEDAKINFGDF